MQRNLDSLDVKVLEALSIHGPRNFREVARAIGIAPTTLHDRLEKLTSHFFLFLFTSIYTVNLGLKKAIIVAKAKAGQEELLLNSLKANGFWTYLSRFFGMKEGYIGVYTIPINHAEEFLTFLTELERLGAVESLQYIWTTSLQAVNPKSAQFDPRSGNWTFEWDKWIKEIPIQTTGLPYTLKDPENFPIRGDETDMFILKEFEKDATVTFSELAKKLAMTPPAIRSRYKRLLKQELIEGFEIHFFPVEITKAFALYCTFAFDSREKLSKFARSLLNKGPFISSLGKVLGQEKLIAAFYLPCYEFRNFINALIELKKQRILESYSYVFQDLKKTYRRTFPYEFFKDKTWVYNHKEHLETLQRVIKQYRT